MVSEIIYNIIFSEKTPWTEEVKRVSDYHFATNRGSHEEILYVIRVESFSDVTKAPVRINGVVLSLKAGQVKKSNDGDFFAYQIKWPASKKQMRQIKDYFVKEIESF